VRSHARLERVTPHAEQKRADRHREGVRPCVREHRDADGHQQQSGRREDHAGRTCLLTIPAGGARNLYAIASGCMSRPTSPLCAASTNSPRTDQQQPAAAVEVPESAHRHRGHAVATIRYVVTSHGLGRAAQ
jgi:hypothetical protein